MFSIWTLPYVGLSYTGQQTFTWTEQTTPIKSQPLTYGTVMLRKVHRKSQSSIHMEVQLKAKSTQQKLRACSKTVFLRHLHLTALYSRQEKFGALQQCFSFIFLSLLTPPSRVLLEKLTGSQLVKKLPTFCGTRKSIIAFKTARLPSLSWARSIQSIPPHPTSWRSILIVSSNLCLVVSFPQGSPPKPCRHFCSRHTCYMPHPSHSSRFDHLNNIGWGVQTTKLLIM